MSHACRSIVRPHRPLSRVLAVAALLSLVVLVATTVHAAQSSPPTERPRGPERAASVEGSMKAMNRALKQLKATIGDASQKDANLKLIDDMQRAAVTAKSMPLPASLLEPAADEAARAKLVETFRADLIAVLREMLDTEHAVLVGRVEVAKSHLAEVEKLRDKAHKALGVED